MTKKTIKPKSFGLTFGFNYKLLYWLSPLIDIGFLIIERNTLGYLLNIQTIPWSVGARVYPSGSSSYGFFFYPKIGGTYLSLGIKDKYNNNYIINTKEHGIYSSLEIGYRRLLFPKSMSLNRVKLLIDISFFDLGYYFNALDSRILEKNVVFLNKEFVLSDMLGSGVEKFLNIRALILPRVGISVRF